MRGGSQYRKILIVGILLCLTVLAQSAALLEQASPHHSGNHCCLLCHVGPLPFLQTTVASVLAPVLRVIWLAPTPRIESSSNVCLYPSPSRAPPAA
jgi:hypothetical protein